MQWEKRSKPAIMAWKALKQRAIASSMAEGTVDASNVETLRKLNTGAMQLNMDALQIMSGSYFLPRGPIAVTNVAPQEDKDRWRQETLEVNLQAAIGPNKAQKALARRTLIAMLGEAEALRLIAEAKADGATA